jgi:hypothetical protein
MKNTEESVKEVLKKQNETDIQIMVEIGKAFASFGAKSDLMCIIGSYRDTLPDDEILQMLKEYNSEEGLVTK